MEDWAPFVFVAGLAGAAYGLHLIWNYALRPAWRFIVAFVQFVESVGVLLEIAAEFKPNGGHSLRDQVDSLHVRMGNIEQQLEQALTRPHEDTP